MNLQKDYYNSVSEEESRSSLALSFGYFRSWRCIGAKRLDVFHWEDSEMFPSSWVLQLNMCCWTWSKWFGKYQWKITMKIESRIHQYRSSLGAVSEQLGSATWWECCLTRSKGFSPTYVTTFRSQWILVSQLGAVSEQLGSATSEGI